MHGARLGQMQALEGVGVPLVLCRLMGQRTERSEDGVRHPVNALS